MAGNGSSDFFLKFGSNADAFSTNLASELAPGIDSIYGLIEAMSDYDKQVEKSGKGNGAFGNLMSALDDVSDTFAGLTTDLRDTFTQAIASVRDLRDDLEMLLRSVENVHKSSATGRAGKGTNATKVEDRIMRDAAELRDQVNTSNRKTIQDATAARNALKRVADINATVAKNAGDAAYSLQFLGQQIREFRSATNGANERLKNGVGEPSGVTGNVQGSIYVNNTAANPVPVFITGGEGVKLAEGSRVPPAVSAAAPAAEAARTVEALAGPTGDGTRKNPYRVMPDDLASAFKGKGYVLLPGQEKPARVPYGVRDNETFRQYHERVSAVSGREADLLRTLPQMSAEDQRLLELFLKGGGEFPKHVMRTVDERRGSMVASPDLMTEIANGNPMSFGALTPGQIEKLPAMLERRDKIMVARNEALMKFMEEELRRDPLMTTDGFSAEGKFALKQVDENLRATAQTGIYAAQDDGLRGVELRAAQREAGTELFENRHMLNVSRKGMEAYDARQAQFAQAAVDDEALNESRKQAERRRAAGSIQGASDLASFAENVKKNFSEKGPSYFTNDALRSEGLPTILEAAKPLIEEAQATIQRLETRLSNGTERNPDKARARVADARGFLAQIKTLQDTLRAPSRKGVEEAERELKSIRNAADPVAGPLAAYQAALEKSLREQGKEVQASDRFSAASSALRDFDAANPRPDIEDILGPEPEFEGKEDIRQKFLQSVEYKNRIAALDPTDDDYHHYAADLELKSEAKRREIEAAGPQAQEFAEYLAQKRDLSESHTIARLPFALEYATAEREYKDRQKATEAAQKDVERTEFNYRSASSGTARESRDRQLAAAEQILAREKAAYDEALARFQNAGPAFDQAAALIEQIAQKLNDRLEKVIEEETPNLSTPAEDKPSARRRGRGTGVNLGNVAEAQTEDTETLTDRGRVHNANQRLFRLQQQQKANPDAVTDEEIAQAQADVQHAKEIRRANNAARGTNAGGKPAASPTAAQREERRRQRNQQARDAAGAGPAEPDERVNNPYEDEITRLNRDLLELRRTYARGKANGERDDALGGAIAALDNEVQELKEKRRQFNQEQFRKNRASGGSGGGGRKPPTGGGGTADDDDDDADESANTSKASGSGSSRSRKQRKSKANPIDQSANAATFTAATRQIVEENKALYEQAKAAGDAAKAMEALLRASAAYRADPAFKNLPNQETRKATFAQMFGLPAGSENNRLLTDVFKKGGYLDAQPGYALPKSSSSSGAGGFLDRGLKKVGLAIENYFGFQLAFTGFEKLRELVQTGIEADQAWTRLKLSLDAAGRSTGNLRSQLQGISSATGEHLTEVTQAAAELVGVFNNNADLTFGTRIAAQLSNISQGSLTAKEAAVGLRDVVDAFGLTASPQNVQKVGDQIAALSMNTGVSVKDITEGTTQIAQEARQYGLTEGQAATLSAYVTRNTGETGEQAAEQVSRVLATLNNGKVQDVLVRTGVATREQFQSGDMAGVITSLLSKYKNGLSAPQQQEIAALAGSGRQARAFLGLINDGTEIVKEFNQPLASTGDLARANAAYMATLAGQIKQLGNDFRNLGSTLNQLGLFDFIGVLAKSLDLLFKAFNATFGRLADILNSNPITSSMKTMIALITEATVAMRLFSVVGSAALGKLGLTGAAKIVGGGAPAIGGAIVSGVSTGASLLTPTGFRKWRDAERFAEDGTAIAPGRFRGFAQNLAANYASGVSTSLGIGASGMEKELTGLEGRLAGTTDKFAGLRNALSKTALPISNAAVAMLGFAAAVGVLVAAFENYSSINSANTDITDRFYGRTGDKAPNDNRSADQVATDKDLQAGRDVNTGSVARGVLGTLVDATPVVGSVANFIPGVKNFLHPSMGNTSDESDKAETDITMKSLAALRAAIKTGDPKKIKEAQAAIDKNIVDNAKKIAEAGGNDKAAQNEIYSQLSGLRQTIQDTGDKRLKILQGTHEIDLLNAQQMLMLSDFVSQTGSLNGDTLRTFSAATKALFQDTGINDQSKTGKNLLTSINGNVSDKDRLQARADALKTTIDQQTVDLQNLNKYPLQGSEREAAQKKLQADIMAYQQIKQALYQNASQTAQGAASLSESTGNDATAVTQLQDANNALGSYLSTLDNTEPEYWSTLQQIQANKAKIAELMDSGIVQQFEQQAASTNDPLKKAQADYMAAIAKAASLFGVGSSQQISDAQGRANSAYIGIAQAQENQTAAGVSAQNANYRNSVLKGQADLNEILRQEAVYSQGVLADQTKFNELKAQEVQARQSLADNIEATKEAGLTAYVSFDKLHGLDVKAATDELRKANMAYAYAVQQYGKYSVEAGQALAQVFADQQAVSDAALQQVNSGLELQIAQLNARGALGDDVKASNLKVQEAKNALNAYLSRGGVKGTAEYNKLTGDIATAQRNAFDTALNAQLDTLDFQRETYKITSAQEVQALQQILKNKQLTLKEQRDITLKIKNLQESIRQQLTEGGLNIPSDIKLPTAYEVRRSLGAGFGGSKTSVVNNNQTANVTVNNNVPTAQVAAQIATQVISLINAQTGAQVRANASTPRLIPVN